jgi:hypothetical protein
MKRLTTAASFVTLAVVMYLGGRIVLSRSEKAVLAGKSPHNSIGTVLKKEHSRVNGKQGIGSLDVERFLVYYISSTPPPEGMRS